MAPPSALQATYLASSSALQALPWHLLHREPEAASGRVETREEGEEEEQPTPVGVEISLLIFFCFVFRSHETRVKRKSVVCK